MKQYGFLYSNFEKMKSYICSKSIDKNDNILVQIFTGIIEIKFIENIISEILSLLPQAEIIGATTGGEIYKNKTHEGSTVVSFTVFEKTKVKSKILTNKKNEYELGTNIAKDLVEEDTKVLILFADGLLTKSFDILKGIQAINNNIIVCGGKAGDNGYLKETFVFTKKGITKYGVAAVSLTGKELNVITDYSFGWSMIGKPMTITKASDNIVYTIDDVKTVDIYKKYLGHRVAENLPMSATEFPLIEIRNGIKIAKVPFACNNDGSLTFLSNVRTNDKVRFGYGNVNVLLDESLKICDRLSNTNAQVLFVYSCSIRKAFMQKDIDIEINPLGDIAPVFGFFTYGEFYTCNNSNRLMNVTMTILGLSEGKQNPDKNKHMPAVKNEKHVKNFYEGKELGAVRAFTNLVDETTKELQETNEVLMREKRRIEKMNDITKFIFEINSQIISSGEYDKFFQIMLDKTLDVIMKGKMGSILMMEDNKLCYKATRGYISENIKGMAYDVENLYKYNIKDSFEPIIFKSAGEKLFFKLGKYDYWKDLLVQEPKEDLLCCIGIDGKIAGLINVFNTTDKGNFDEKDKELLKYICYDMVIALKNIKLLQDTLNMSRYDYLTGVCNRSYFSELINEILKESKTSGKSFTVCGLDLNNFKTINDTCGHTKGDEILKEFAKIFKNGIDKDDILARIGGDEFVAVFVDKGKEQVINMLNEISMELKNNIFWHDDDINDISFAYGLSQFPYDSCSIEELLKIADKRMYENKNMMKPSGN